MKGAVNALGTETTAGYTAATKVDQISVLMNAAFGIAISNYVAQNYGASLQDRIRKGHVGCWCQYTGILLKKVRNLWIFIIAGRLYSRSGFFITNVLRTAEMQNTE